MRRLTLSALALLLQPLLATAGPWPAGRGHVYVKLSYGHLESTTLAAPDGTRFTIPQFTRDELGVYAAIGLSERLTLIADVPALRSSNLADEPDELARESGFGDLRLGVQLQLGQRGGWLFALRGLAQAPTGDATRADGLLPTGSGVFEGGLVLGAGRSLAGGRFYAFGEIGHGLRGGQLRDTLLWEAQIGWNATPRLVLAANLRGVEPYSRAPRATALGSPVGLSDRVTYVNYGPTAILTLARGLFLQLDVEAAFHTRNLAHGTSYRAGIAFAR